MSYVTNDFHLWLSTDISVTFNFNCYDRSLASFFFFFDSSFESSWLEGLIEFVMAGTYGCDFLPLLADHGIGIILLLQASSTCDDVAHILNGLFFLS